MNHKRFLRRRAEAAATTVKEQTEIIISYFRHMDEPEQLIAAMKAF